jgi:antirestriction protein ArdC
MMKSPARILAELEAGRLPWVQPWGTAAAKAPLAMPKNAATGRQYSGINVLIFWAHGESKLAARCASRGPYWRWDLAARADGEHGAA